MTDQIPPGYKKTDIGIIPEDWEVKRLGEIAVCLDEYRIPLNEEERRKMKGTIPYCGANGILDYVKDYTIDDNIILLAEDGGHFDEYKDKPIAYRMIGKCWVNNHAHILKAKDGHSQDFLFYSLVHKDIREYIGGGTRAKLNKGEMLKIEIPLPPRPEQRAIARILSDFDALIESLDRLIEKKKAIKKGAMQELLTGKKRLPGFTGEWVRKRLGEIFELYSTTSKNKYISSGGKYIIMDMGAVSKEGKIIPNKRTFMGKDLLKADDLVMPKDDIGDGLIIGKVAIIPENGRFVLGDHVYRLRVKTNHYYPKFFYYLINSPYINAELKRKVTGSAQKGLSQKSVIEQEVSYPPTLEEQRAIAQILSDMDEEIEALERKKEKYEMMKRGTMELLLTGKIRVKEENGKITRCNSGLETIYLSKKADSITSENTDMGPSKPLTVPKIGRYGDE